MISFDLNNSFFDSVSDHDHSTAYIVSNRFKDESEALPNRWWYHSNLIFDLRRVNRIVKQLENQKVLEIKITRLKVPSFFTEIPKILKDYSQPTL